MAEALSAAYRLVEKRTVFRPEESRHEFTVMTAGYAEIRQAMYWHERTHNEPSHQCQLISDLAKAL